MFVLSTLFSYIFSSKIPLRWIVIPILTNVPFSIMRYFKFQKDRVIVKQRVESIIINNKNEIVFSYYNDDFTKYSTVNVTLPKEENKKKEAAIKIKELDVIQYG